MPREVIYVIVALCCAVVCLVLVVGVRREIRQPSSLPRRLAVLLALALALFAVWSMIWPVTGRAGQYCGIAPGVLTETPTASDLGLQGAAAQAHQDCMNARWLRLVLGLAAGTGALLALALTRDASTSRQVRAPLRQRGKPHPAQQAQNEPSNRLTES